MRIKIEELFQKNECLKFVIVCGTRFFFSCNDAVRSSFHSITCEASYEACYSELLEAS